MKSQFQLQWIMNILANVQFQVLFGDTSSKSEQEIRLIVKKFYYLFSATATSTLSKQNSDKINSCIENIIKNLNDNEKLKSTKTYNDDSNVIREVLLECQNLNTFCIHLIESIETNNKAILDYCPALNKYISDVVVKEFNKIKMAEKRARITKATIEKRKKEFILLGIILISQFFYHSFQQEFNKLYLLIFYLICSTQLYFPYTMKKFFFLLTSSLPIAVIQNPEVNLFAENFHFSFIQTADEKGLFLIISYVVIVIVFFGTEIKNFILEVISILFRK